MNIIGPDFLVFGVDEVEGCRQFLADYGLRPLDDGATFVALDGTGIIIKSREDSSLPAPLPTSSMLRQQIYGVGDSADLQAIANELEKDRDVRRLADGTVECFDDAGFALKFQVTVRRPIDAPAEKVNSPGHDPLRDVNELGVWEGMAALPRTLSHVVLFVPDVPAAADFYVRRLGFRVTDVFTGVGPFLRPQGTQDHHTLFLIGTPPFMQGCEHLTFHMGGPTEVMIAGTRLVEGGYQSFWGPGRHKFGSNWFWYFNSPLGCHVEYDADMDKHDDAWIAREAAISEDASQMFLFRSTPRWFPSGGPDQDHD